MEMEKDISANKLYQEFPILRDRSALNAIKCKSGQNGIYVCFNKQCQNNPFMCVQKTCACKKDHEKCFKSLLQDFILKFQNKVIDVSSLIQQNDKMIDQFIQNIVNQVAKIKESFKVQMQAKAKTLSFNSDELEILTNIQKNKVNHLKGNDFYRIYTCLEQKTKNQNSDQINLNEQLKQGQQTWKNLEIKIFQELHNIESNFKNNQNGFYFRKIFKCSKISIQKQEDIILKGFFNKKIKNAQILYRASQNQFTVQIFKNNCCEIPNTLTLIETSQGKKVGGFTPLTWEKTTDWKFQEDNSNQTFIFSLSQNQKFSQITDSGIAMAPQYGPIFGHKSSHCDLAICEKSNIRIHSTITFNNAFTNPRFTQPNQQNHLKFNGDQNNSSALYLKEWQVWKITFQQ